MIKNKANLIIIVLVTIIFILIVASINLVKDNEDNINKQEIQEIKIKSKILKEVIENSWKADYDFGTKESTFDKYSIYFDEGIEVRNVGNKIHNIVFTEKYKKNIINNIKSNESIDKIIEELGQPDFGGESINLIGYELDNIYIFFNGKQASIYRKQDIIIDQNVFLKTYNNKNEFIKAINYEWKDSDIYINESNEETIQYALLNYMYKGIVISVIEDDIKITVYNNCTIKIPNNTMYKVETKNKNLIYHMETERQNSVHNREYAYAEYQASVNNIPVGIDEMDLENNEYKNIDSKKFVYAQMDFNTSGEYKLMFISIDGEFPNSEIEEMVISNIWLDDYNIIYSVKNKGIYLYNVKTLEKKTIKEGTDDFILIGLTKDNKLEYDNTEIKIDLK